MITRAFSANGTSRTHRPGTRCVGRWADDGFTVAVIPGDDAETSRLLPLPLDLRNHSPSGFAWGYGGSRPAQIALAIRADAVGDDLDERHYQDFKRAIIASLDHERPWEIIRELITNCIARQPALTGDCA